MKRGSARRGSAGKGALSASAVTTPVPREWLSTAPNISLTAVNYPTASPSRQAHGQHPFITPIKRRLKRRCSLESLSAARPIFSLFPTSSRPYIPSLLAWKAMLAMAMVLLAVRVLTILAHERVL